MGRERRFSKLPLDLSVPTWMKGNPSDGEIANLARARSPGSSSNTLADTGGAIMEKLSPDTIRRGLTTRFMGQEVVCYDSVSSTNEVAKELARQGAPDGTLIIADEQTAGKGRQGRSWFAPRGTDLLLSLILHPSLTTSEMPRLTMASSLAVANAIEEVTGLPVQFKWPNDILLGEKKTGGILTEVSLSGDVHDYAVIGIGVNVNLDVSLIPEIADVATSIAEELGRPASRLELLRVLLRLMESEYDLLLRGESPHERWMTRLRLLGDKVQVTTPWGKESGRADTVDADGALVLRRPDGTIVRITVGDVE